jgi:methylated-DNA-[protein]-cysteine S-methyltransferase
VKGVNTDFTARVLAVVRRIPAGRVATYGDVAALAGKPLAARAVGNIMRDCGRADVPCHRVIGAGGRLGGYGGNEVLKRALLVAEGVVIHGSRVQLLGCRFAGAQKMGRNAGRLYNQKGKVPRSQGEVPRGHRRRE